MASARKQNAQRQHMAQLAARLMSEQGIRDFRIAKQKAAQHLGIDVRNSVLPKNSEIEAALAATLDEPLRDFRHTVAAIRYTAPAQAE